MAGFIPPIAGPTDTGKGPGEPTPAERTGFKDGLKDKSSEDLMKDLTSKDLKPWQQEEIMKALGEKLGDKKDDQKKSEDPKKPGEAGGAKDKDKDGEDDQDELKKLLKKLKSGKITPDELQKLQGLMEKMGAPPEAVQNMIKDSGQTPPDPNKVS